MKNIKSDTEILDWIQAKMKPGVFLELSFSDSRDMGYKNGFLAFWSNEIDVSSSIKGNTIREALSNAIERSSREDE